MSASAHPDFEVLLRYVRDELPVAEVGALEERLMRDDALVRELVRISIEEAILAEWAGGLSSKIETPARVFVVQASIWKRAARSRLFWGATAALLFLSVMTFIWVGRAENLPGGPPVARITALDGVQWASGQRALRNGTGIPSGVTLATSGGALELTFVNGARVWLRGATTYTLDSELSGTLQLGAVAATVPPSAAGFTVRTKALDVRDNGTQFGVRLTTGGAEVHVFEGSVDASSRGQIPIHTPISMAQAAAFNADGKPAQWIAPDYSGFAVAPVALGIKSIGQNMRWVAVPPASLEKGKLESDERVFLLRERSGVVLSKDIQVTFKPPTSGTRSSYNKNSATIKAGTKVDSYLLHLDAPSRQAFLDGSVEFERPILGVIARGDQLSASDEVLGLPAVRYEKTRVAERGLDEARTSGAPDVLSFEHMPVGIGTHCEVRNDALDEIRILIASDDAK